MESITTMTIAQIGVLLFLLITFGISVIEKLIDWKGTILFIKENFKRTFIKAFISPLIIVLLFLEIVTCVLLIIGGYNLIFKETSQIAFLGCVFSALCVLYMLIGQRIAKDYVGATSLTVYFILITIGMFLLK